VDGGLYQDDEDADDAYADAARWGIDPAQFNLPERENGIWAVHLPALHGFLACQTQWCVIALADGQVRRTGLDYARAQAGLRMARIRLTADQWADLRLIEAGALDAYNRPVPA
jgi:Phage related hypothetical protein (DUF1799)